MRGVSLPGPGMPIALHLGMASDQLHEDAAVLRSETREMHRAIASLMEELEAIDWYAQRIDASSDPELAKVLEHNRGEEIEHACMVLEWIRRHDARFDQYLRTYLFSPGPIEETEDDTEALNRGGTLGIGSLRSAEAT
jgi:uncharacterized protein